MSTDVVVVGGGVAGLAAALAARDAGLEVTLLESTALLGGSTTSDNGHVWLPGAHSPRSGDAAEDARAYLDAVLPTPGGASSAERRDAFVGAGAEVAAWLGRHGVALTPVRGRPDFHPSAAGARKGGRTLCGPAVDRRSLGAWAERLRPNRYIPERPPRSWRGLLSAGRALAPRFGNRPRETVTGGAALSAALVRRAAETGVSIVCEAPFVDLILVEGAVTGVVARRGGADVRLLARRGVILACGGFEGNQELREQYLPRPTDARWTTGLDSNDGRGLLAAKRAGAALAGLDDAWWTLVAVFDGVPYCMTSERSLPHSVIVDRAGDRFIDEASPLPETARRLFDQHRGRWAIPSYLIVDNAHRRRYRMGPCLPGSPAGTGSLVSAMSLVELSRRLGIDTAGLIGTVAAFNGGAAKGRDPDFERGVSLADRAAGDATQLRNPNLGKVDRAPFWAAALYPGDAGTKGGVVVDASSRALRADGAAIPALYAVGGTAASLFPATAPGSGAGLGSALVDAYLAIRAIRDDAAPGSPGNPPHRASGGWDESPPAG